MLIRAAGVVYFCRSNNRLFVLLGKRSHNSPNPRQWASFGGKIELGERPRDAALREVEEETGYKDADSESLRLLYISNNGDCRFFCYFKEVSKQFAVPALDKTEHSESGWFDITNLPSPVIEPLAINLKRLKKSVLTEGGLTGLSPADKHGWHPDQLSKFYRSLGVKPEIVAAQDEKEWLMKMAREALENHRHLAKLADLGFVKFGGQEWITGDNGPVASQWFKNGGGDLARILSDGSDTIIKEKHGFGNKIFE